MAATSPLSSQINVQKLISDLKECVQELSSEFSNSNIPIDDDNAVLQRLCWKLEQFLLLGFLERTGLFSRKKSYWEFFKSTLVASGKGGVESGVKFANNNPEVRSSLGRGRAFIRYCLVHGCLGDALQQSLLSGDSQATWYAASAPLRDAELSQQLVAIVYELSDVHFDLAAGGHDLDSGWPTFARRQFSSGGLTWRPLSRSTSIASLSSSFNASFQDPGSPPPGQMGAMESLPEGQPLRRDDNNTMWWGEGGAQPPIVRTHDQQVQTESISEEIATKLQVVQLNAAPSSSDASSLISQHETEVKALNDKLQLLEVENRRLQTETLTIKEESSHNENEIERLRKQVSELRASLNDAQTVRKESEGAKDAEVHELRMRLSENRSENNVLMTRVSELEVLNSQLQGQFSDIGQLKASLERSVAECQRLKEEMGDAQELKSQLLESQATIERMETKIKLDESKMQQAKWEMSSLQTQVDNLLKENDQLRNDLTQISTTVHESRDKYTTNELYAEKLTEQVVALKDVVSIGKQMLAMRDAEVEQLQRKQQTLEDMLETEREKNSILSQAFDPECVGNANLKKEYETQLANLQSLRDIYERRTELMGLENQALKDTLGDKDRQIELMDKRYSDLNAQYGPLRESLGTKEEAVNALQRQVYDLKEDCRALNNQLSMISNLFNELGKSDVDLDKLRSLQDAMAEGITDSENSMTSLSKFWCSLSELLENQSSGTPQPVEGSEGCYKSVQTPYGPRLVISVSQTFLRLKDLILEKKSLQREVGQLRNLNTHLDTKLQQQEKRLSLVLQELKKTWAVVNKMRSQHSQLRTSEAILRYDLQQKRKIVNELKEELEYCRDTWQQAREKTSESEEQYRTLRDEFASRRRRPLVADDSTEVNSAESGYSDGRGEDDSGGSSTSDCEENTGDCTGSEPSDSPDILPSPEILPSDSRPSSATFTDSTLSADTELEVQSPLQSSDSPSDSPKITQELQSPPPSPSTGAIRKTINVPAPEPVPQQEPQRVNVEGILDARAARLKRLEEQCSQLFKRVVRTSNMSVAISNRLEEIHGHYIDSEEKRAARLSKSPSTGSFDTKTSPAVPNNRSDIAIPTPPPMPLVIPAIRLPTSIKHLEEASQVFFEVPEPKDEMEQDFQAVPPPPRLPEKVDVSATNIAALPQRDREPKVSETQAVALAELEAERENSERLGRQLTSLGVELASQGRELEELRRKLEEEVATRQGVETDLETKQGLCDTLALKVEQLSERERELQARLSQTEEQAGNRLEELKQLQSDTTRLHEAIIKLTREKDALFKESYALKQAQRENSTIWQHDHQVTTCQGCSVSFSLLVRKHHCRQCGRIFCGACSSHWINAKDSSHRSRACSDCHSKHQIDGTSSSSSLESSMLLTSGESSTETAATGSMVNGEDPDEEDEEEDFSVISEEEVVLSQCVPYSPNPEILQYWKSCEIQSGLTRDVGELIAAGTPVNESVWVRAGVILAVPLLVKPEDCVPQATVTWQFTTEPKCIAFSVLYKKDADIPSENSSVLVPTTRVNSHLQAIRGRLRARREGIYTLLFDNSYSRFTGKKVNFTLNCEIGSGGSSSGRSSAGPSSPLHGPTSTESPVFSRNRATAKITVKY